MSCPVHHTSKRAQKQSSGGERGLGQGTDRGGRGQGRPASNRSQEAPARLRGAPSVATCLDDGAHSSASWESRSRLGHLYFDATRDTVKTHARAVLRKHRKELCATLSGDGQPQAGRFVCDVCAVHRASLTREDRRRGEHSARPPTNAPAPALCANTAAAIAAAEASAAPPPPFYAATVAPLQIGGGGRLEQRLGNLCQTNILHGAAVARSQATGVTEVEDD
ncbi:hypothetical protein MRX96_002055 [Rhipicephalus microplus]